MTWLVIFLYLTEVAQAATITIEAPDAVVERVLNFGCRYRGPCGPGTPSQRLEILRKIMASESRITVVWDDPTLDTWRDADGQRPPTVEVLFP